MKLRHIIKAEPFVGSLSVPVGWMPEGGWISDTIPAGFLECNGQMVSRLAFPELFEAIGWTCGHDPAHPYLFALPDMRGQCDRPAPPPPPPWLDVRGRPAPPPSTTEDAHRYRPTEFDWIRVAGVLAIIVLAASAIWGRAAAAYFCGAPP